MASQQSKQVSSTLRAIAFGLAGIGAACLAISSGGCSSCATPAAAEGEGEVGEGEGEGEGVALASITISPAEASLPSGFTLAFTAVGTFSDGSTRDVTAEATWASSDDAIASISNDPASAGVATGVSVGSANITASLEGVNATASVEVTDAALASIAVAPPTAFAGIGEVVAFSATGTFSDATTLDITTGVTWSTTDTAVATVSNDAGSQGAATAVATGSATIVASLAGLSGSATLEVTDARLVSLALTPPSASLPAGFTQAFAATGTFSDGSTQDLTAQALWTSSDTTVATVSNAPGTQGLVTGAAPGTATIAADVGGIAASATLDVSAAALASIAVAPTSALIGVGETRSFVATGTFSDGTSRDVTGEVSWSSTNPGVATVSNNPGTQGQATSVSAGSATIIASAGGISGSATLDVSNAVLVSIAVAPSATSLPVGFTQPFTATGTFTDGSTRDLTDQVLWATNNGAVATISNAAGSQGIATGVSPGAATITATLSGISGSASVTVSAAILTSIGVTPSPASVAIGLSLQLSATGGFSDGSSRDITTLVAWSSTNGAVATVSNAAGSDGVATGIGAGSADIIAALDGISGSATLTVSAATLTSIAVAPAMASVAAGLTRAFTATGTFSDGSTQNITTQATWSSSNAAVATVSNDIGTQGVATGQSVGGATITATLGGVSGSATLSVSAAVLVSITVAPSNASISVGGTQAFTAQGLFSDGTTADVTTAVTWSTSDGSVATISNGGGNQGRATGVGGGTATVIATGAGGVTGTATINVAGVTLTAISVSPGNATLPQGAPQRFAATGTFSDGSSADLTAQVTWSSSNTGVATISNNGGLEGVATTVAAGSTTITATQGGVAGSTTLTVNNVTLTSISMAPANPTIGEGNSVDLNATGNYSDGSTRSLTAFADWTSSDTNVVAVGNAPGNKGTVDGVAPGQADVTASFGGRAGTSSVTVN